MYKQTKTGAHHVELRGDDKCDAQDVIDGRIEILNILTQWIGDFKKEQVGVGKTLISWLDSWNILYE